MKLEALMLSLAAAACLVALPACDDGAEGAGRKIDDAVEKTGEAVEDAWEDVKEAVDD